MAATQGCWTLQDQMLCGCGAAMLNGALSGLNHITAAIKSSTSETRSFVAIGRRDKLVEASRNAPRRLRILVGMIDHDPAQIFGRWQNGTITQGVIQEIISYRAVTPIRRELSHGC